MTSTHPASSNRLSDDEVDTALFHTNRDRLFGPLSSQLEALEGGIEWDTDCPPEAVEAALDYIQDRNRFGTRRRIRPGGSPSLSLRHSMV